MRRISKKQQKMIDDNREWRTEWSQSVNSCMWCGNKFHAYVTGSPVVHEMLPGRNRSKAYERRECCLVVCHFCNTYLLPALHLYQQLARKLIYDPLYFDLDVIRECYRGGELATMEDVRRGYYEWRPALRGVRSGNGQDSIGMVLP